MYMATARNLNVLFRLMKLSDIIRHIQFSIVAVYKHTHKDCVCACAYVENCENYDEAKLRGSCLRVFRHYKSTLANIVKG
jgi:hypothetical protein